MARLAIQNLKIHLFNTEDTFSFYFMAVIIITAIALFNRIKLLFKIRSIAFVVIFLILYSLQSHIEVFTTTLGLISIPLLVDDFIVNNYFKFLNTTKYWDVYKDVVARE